MSDNLTVFSTNYTNVTGIKAKGTGNGTLTYIRPTGTKSITANGTGIDVAAYSLVDVAVSGGGSGSPYYARAVVVPEQTVTLDGDKKGVLSDVTIGLSLNGFYIVTFNGVEYYVTCHALFDWYLCIGDVNIQIKGQSEANSMTPFFIVSTDNMTQLSLTLWCKSDSASTVSVKVEELFFTDEITVAENIVPQQTVTLDSNRMANLTATGTITQGYHYAITFDDVEYVCTAALLWNDSEHALGDSFIPHVSRNDYLYPFYIARGTGGTDVMGITANTSHTVKVDRIELPEGGGITIDPLTVTSNGTYTAQTNHAYTPVTVNVPSGGGTYQAKTNISPTTSSQTILPDSGYDALSSVQINAMPSGTAGTPTATKGTVSNHSISVTPSVTNMTGYITGGTKTGTAVTVSASELVSGSQTITDNGTVDVTNLASVIVDVSGSGSDSVQVDIITETYSRAGSYVWFGDLKGEPTSFVVVCTEEISTNSTPLVARIVYDGTSLHGQTITNTSNAQVSYNTDFSYRYQDGLIVSSVGSAEFYNNSSTSYVLIYTYGGTSACIDTKDIQVGSGVTSITFTGLKDEPLYWSCIFKSNFGTSSGYQRVIGTECYNNSVTGAEMDSTAHFSNHWTANYSNGSLTIASQGTNVGGYFHQPGYYQLTYAYNATGNYQSKTVIPSASEQVITADAQYDALEKVTVAAVPTGEYDIDITNSQFYDDNGTRKWRARADMDVWDGWLPEGSYYGPYLTRNAISANTTVTPTTSAQTIGGTNYVMEGAVTIAAMPSGTAGTPSATKGSVSNHSIVVTPSVTNTTGYITGSTKTGTAVTVSASELVSGSETKTANGTYDVTNLASLVVSIPIVTYYTSSSAPTSSQGSNGDLWLVTS